MKAVETPNDVHTCRGAITCLGDILHTVGAMDELSRDQKMQVFAPILAFTCDEIWLQMPHRDGDDGRNVLLNQMSKPYTDYALLDTEMAVWETALRVRSDVNGVLETARADKRIGKSLEAHVALFAKDEDTKAALEAVKAIDLPEIFIVSNVSTNETAP